jgi:hypothetical protein
MGGGSQASPIAYGGDWEKLLTAFAEQKRNRAVIRTELFVIWTPPRIARKTLRADSVFMTQQDHGAPLALWRDAWA